MVRDYILKAMPFNHHQFCNTADTARWHIGIDIMGGDEPPQNLANAINRFAATYPTSAHFTLYSTSNLLIEEIPLNSRVKTSICEEAIPPNTLPTSTVSDQLHTSLSISLNDLKNGFTDALISVGSTGALLAQATTMLPLLPDITRPALLIQIPTHKTPLIMLDVGANAACRPQHLIQFAKLGKAFYHYRERNSHDAPNLIPKIGLLNIGTEPIKGTPILRQTYSLLEDLAMKHQITFAGNIEGNQIFDGEIDILVAEGFSGNVLLKTIEGTSDFILQQLQKKQFNQPIQASFEKNSSQIKTFLNYAEYPGALLCGIEHIILKCHSRSNEQAIFSTILKLIELLENNIVQNLKRNLIDNP
ncbi:MAG: Phosphate acyltransferase [Chlamydiales bacterium]|jgi:glycerol-3-phosphate acyltransferase PlsX|nr:Phosphate acyltransferase [Chlamydiales bacterium]